MASISCTVMRTRCPTLRTLPSTTYCTPSSAANFCTSTARPLNLNEELREITNSSRNRDSSVMMSSVMPSAKNSCSGSPLMLLNGSTAIDGLSARSRAPADLAAAGSFAAAGAMAALPAPDRSPGSRAGSGWKRKMRTGSAMFLTACSPKSSKRASTRFFTAHSTGSEIATPPGWASDSSRAAMLTPSP